MYMNAVARYHARHPRYVLDANDNQLIRLSGPDRSPWEEKTEIKNISLSGLSFVCPRDLKPHLSEIIKIQFEVPGSEMMACHGMVTRIENINSFECEVAVHFHKLEKMQRLNLVAGLSLKNATEAKINPPSRKKAFIVGLALFISAMAWITLLKFHFL